MEIDPSLLEKVQSENNEFRKLYEEHTKLKTRVEELNRTALMSPAQELEKKTIQKQKLKSKDRLTVLLDEYQASLR